MTSPKDTPHPPRLGRALRHNRFATQRWPKTLHEAVVYFSDPGTAFAEMVNFRWPDGVVRCPTCGNEQVYFIAAYWIWKCRTDHPRRQFSVKAGSIMENSKLGARPSNRYESHFASFCAPPQFVDESIAALSDGDDSSLGEICEPDGRFVRPIIGTGDTSSECCASCTPATIHLGPSPAHARGTGESPAPA